MKKRLLITLGCSGTEGIGCFPLDVVDKSITYDRDEFHLTKEYHDLREDFIDRCHELGWPNQLGKKLGVDKVLNLGLGGSSTSGQLKVFVEKYLETDFSDWEVLVFWLLTESSRFSFYSYGEVNNIIVTQGYYNKKIEQGYLELINDINVDPILEQIFYVKMMEQICENKGYQLLITHGFGDQDPLIKKRYKSKNYLTNEPFNIFPLSKDQFDEFLSPYCWHPNEFGYELISQRIYDKIKENHPQYVGISKDKIDWEWDGVPYQHLEILIEDMEVIDPIVVVPPTITLI